MTTQTQTTENMTSLKALANFRNLLPLFALITTTCLAFLGTGCSDDGPIAPVPAASEPRVNSVEIRNAPVSMVLGTFAYLSATVDADVEIENRNIVWSSSAPGLLRVDNRGKITAISPGTVEVTARAEIDDKVRDRVRVVVTSPGATVDNVTLEPAAEDLYVGNTLTLTADVTSTGSADPSLNWRSNRPHIASVDANGVVTAEASGTFEITAESKTDPTKSASLPLEALPAHISLDLSAPMIVMHPGSSQDLELTVETLGRIDTSVFWMTSDEAILTVVDGRVTAIAPGTAEIMVRASADESVEAGVEITVGEPDATIESVTIDPAMSDFYFGDTMSLTARVNGTGSFDPGVNWRSNRPHIASVNANGVVVAESTGTVEITAESMADPSKLARLTLEVKAAAIDLHLSALQDEMLPGTSQDLELRVETLGRIDTSVLWMTSDDAILTVVDGRVTAVAPGNAEIMVRASADESVEVGVEITVGEPDATIESVTIDPATSDFYFGDTMSLSARVNGTGSFDPNVNWRSNRPHIASVDARGVMIAEGVGIVEITAESLADPSKLDRLTLDVKAATIRLNLNASGSEMFAGTSQQLELLVEVFGRIDDSVRWTTSDAAVSTVEGGNVTAHGLGTVTIEAVSIADETQSARVELTVSPVIPQMEGNPVSGWDANFVEYASADARMIGRFTQGHGKNWEDTNSQGTFNFIETSRDDWAINLHDATRGIDVQLNLWRKYVRIAGQDEYIVTDAGSTPVEPMVGTPVSGWDANFVEYSSADRSVFGTFHRVQGANEWVEENNQSTSNFVETRRDEWSIYLQDAGRGMEVQLDLYTKKVTVIGYFDYIVTDAR